MESVKYISHKFIDNVDDIKALALYFDHIDIIEQSYYHAFEIPSAKVTEEIDDLGNKRLYRKHRLITSSEFTSLEFKGHLKPLIDEKIVSFTNDYGENIMTPIEFYKSETLPFLPVSKSKWVVDPKYHLPSKIKDKLAFINNDKINDLIINLFNSKLKYNSETIYLNKELVKEKLFYNQLFNEPSLKRVATSNSSDSISDTFKTKDFYTQEYLGKLFQSYIDYSSLGCNTITTSKIMHELIKESNNEINIAAINEKFKNELNVNPFLINETIKIAVPDLSRFPTEEIIEFKHKSKDELLAFKTTLEEITLDLLSNHSQAFITANAQKIAEIKIQPLLNDINLKLGDSKLTLTRALIQEVRDPKSYSPLILSLSSNVSTTLIYLLSLGIISFNTALEYYSKNKETKKDGVYYLFKASKYFA